MYGMYYLLYTNKWGTTFGGQGCELRLKACTTGNVWCLGIRRLVSGAVVTLAKGDVYLALEDVSIDVIMYLGDGVHCLIRSGRGNYSFETGSAESVELSMRILHHRRAVPSALM